MAFLSYLIFVLVNNLKKSKFNSSELALFPILKHIPKGYIENIHLI